MVPLSFHISRRIGCSLTHNFSFLISDSGGCFFSNELREVRGIGLLTAPGKLSWTHADLDLVNLIRVIKRLPRKLAQDNPELAPGFLRSSGLFFSQQRLLDWRILASPMDFRSRQRGARFHDDDSLRE